MSERRRKKAGRAHRVSLCVHPLFFVLGAWFVVQGELFLFCSVTVVAVIHECGHAFYAARVGCRLNRLLLLPCGAVVSGDMTALSLKDEILLSLAGPAVNAACALFFAGLWWFFPATYPYTDTAFHASAFLAAVNLLPAYPLDGGRVLYCAVARRRGEPFARRLCMALSLAFAALLVALFFAMLFARGVCNVTVLLFAAFIVCGTFGGRDCRYERIRFDVSADMKRGAEVRRIALSRACTVKRALSFLQRGKYLEFEVFDEQGAFVCTLTQAEVCELLGSADLYSPIGECIDRSDV